jgi:hypothetical protein
MTLFVVEKNFFPTSSHQASSFFMENAFMQKRIRRNETEKREKLFTASLRGCFSAVDDEVYTISFSLSFIQFAVHRT